MRTTKITYWTATILIFLMDGVMPALTSNTALAREGISHLGYPDYFRVMLTFFKIAGSLVLIIPAIKGRLKEWAYAGFAFNFTCATISHWVVDGFGGQTVFPLVALAILMVSYRSYQRMGNNAGEVNYKGNYSVI